MRDMQAVYGIAHRILLSLTVMALMSVYVTAAPTLKEGFESPPHVAKPHVYYFLMNGNISKEGFTRDFEAMAEAGIGGMIMMDAGCYVPHGKYYFNTPEWFDLLRHAHLEAKRLGLEICMPNCSGWSSSGGPWNPPENGMKWLVTTETNVKGPNKAWSGKLPRTKKDNGFYEDIAVIAYPTPKNGATLTDFKCKRARDRKKGTLVRDTKEFAPEQVVFKEREVVLTDRMKGDGTITWDVPAGDWTILRIGFICNGRTNHPASEGGKGLEVDKLSAKAMDYHFDQYVTKLCGILGVSKDTDNSTGINCIEVDSYEMDYQDWTQGMEKTFEERLGYSITPYLPVFAGRIVDSVDATERFLEDFRRLIADLFAENYSGRLTKLCHDKGLKFALEPYGRSNADDLQYGQPVDYPIAEFWSQAASGPHRRAAETMVARQVAYIGHVWGQRVIGAEAFTATPFNGGRWLTTPFDMKSKGDRAFAEGINRMIYHRYASQPWADDKYLPGLTMGRWGIHLERTQTWWHIAPEFFRYHSRCQWMLQEGKLVSDVLLWRGESAPNDGIYKVEMPKGKSAVPNGYAWDVCPTKAVEMLTVKNGKVVAPSGVEYSILVLPETDTMSERMVRRVGELVDAGAKVVAPMRPSRAFGLCGGAGRDANLRKAVEKVWTKGVIDGTVADALAQLGVKPQVKMSVKDGVWIHRRGDGAEWYFIARNNETCASFDVSLRTSGKEPELWDAETGEIRHAPVWREKNGRTVVTLDFKPSGSVFVVFREPAEKDHVVQVEAKVDLRKDPVAKGTKTHTLVIRKAEYGVFPDSKVNTNRKIPENPIVDVTDKIARRVKNGMVNVRVGVHLAGRDPAWMIRKSTRIEYEYDGKVHNVELKNEGDLFQVPIGAVVPHAPPEWEWKGDDIVAWQPMQAEVKYSDGTTKTAAATPRPAVPVEGSWNVSFPKGWNAPEKTVFPKLASWTENENTGIKYFSGTATYTKDVEIPVLKAGERVMLDLGEVKNFAEVKVNGKSYPPMWRPPFRLDITDAAKAGERLALEIKVTNLWPNRLIGDDVLYEPDCKWKCVSRKGVAEYGIEALPDWVMQGKKSPTGRLAFTTWRHWTKDDKPLPSGILGPVLVRFGAMAECNP